jgi:hypothetical protein
VAARSPLQQHGRAETTRRDLQIAVVIEVGVGTIPGRFVGYGFRMSLVVELCQTVYGLRRRLWPAGLPAHSEDIPPVQQIANVEVYRGRRRLNRISQIDSARHITVEPLLASATGGQQREADIRIGSRALRS